MTVKKAEIIKASAEVQETISAQDVDMVGIASLDNLKGTKLEESVLRLLPTARSMVVVAMEVYPEILDLTSPEQTMGAASLNEIRNNHVDYIRGKMNLAVNAIGRTSRRAGLKAIPLPARGPAVDARFLEAVISYKHAAEAAGIGHIGMSSLVVTPKYGPRVNLAMCLTEAVLESSPVEEKGICRYCNICVSKCPSKALGWPKDDERYVINKFACMTYNNAAGGCGECMKQCPVASPKYM